MEQMKSLAEILTKEELYKLYCDAINDIEELEDELVKSDGKTNSMVSEISDLKDKVEELERTGLKVRQLATEEIEGLQKENESLKQYKKVLMENSIVRSNRIEELERLLEKERNMIDYLVKYHLSGNVYTFERFVEHGRLYAMDKTKEDGHMVNGVPWSFKLNGNAVTHENDECYLVQTKIGFEKFTPKDLLVINSNGQLSVIPFSQSEK